jgi:hypothetical protein
MKPRSPFEPEVYVSKYIDFVKLIKQKYPETKIVLLSSPMINEERRETLQNCLTEVKEKINAEDPQSKPVETFFFQPMQPGGCSWHPSVEDHAVLAEELIPFFRKLLE